MSKIPTGDRGQRYLVTAKWCGITKTVGWSDDIKPLADAIFKHPDVSRVYVIDRQDDNKVVYILKTKDRNRE